MKSFDYTIKDEIGIHARPAGLLVKCAAEFSSAVTISKGEKNADAKKTFCGYGIGGEIRRHGYNLCKRRR